MTKSSTCNKGKALHISQWIKGELGGRKNESIDDNESYREDDDDVLELWSDEQMNAKQAEVQQRLLAIREECGSDGVVYDFVAETVSVVSSPDDSQVSIDDKFSSSIKKKKFLFFKLSFSNLRTFVYFV